MVKENKVQTLTIEEKLEQALVPDWEQPYKVPSNWVWTNIKSICDFERGITFPASAKQKMEGKNLIPCLRTANVQENLRIDDLIYIDRRYMKGNSAKFVRTEDIIMSSANSRELVGKCSYVPELNQEMTFGGFVLMIRAKSIKSKYLFYFLRYEFLSGRFMKESTQTTNIANINSTTLGAYDFPLPPLPEQRRIVSRIESLFEKLDHARELVQSALDSFESRKAAILHKAFAGELTAKWRKENRVGMESWRIQPLGLLLLPMKTKKPTGEIFEYIDIDSINNKTQKVSSPKLLKVTEAPSRAAREVKENDVLFSMVRPYLKNIAFIDASLSNAIASTGFYVCRSRNLLLPRYLYQLLCSNDAIDYLMQFMKGDNSPSIRKQDLEKMPILYPSVSEQQEIIRVLDVLLDKEQQAKDKLEPILDQIDLMKKSILARAFRGELGTNDPSEESAMEFLKEILVTGNQS